MTAKDLLIKSSDITVNDCNTSEEWDTCKCMLRALLVTALIDEGWCFGQNREHELPNTGAALISDYGECLAEYEWPGTIADMPADIYDELKGRLK